VLAQQLNYRRAVELELKPLLTKAGLDVQKLDKMAAQNQSELRRILANNKPEAARRGSLEMAAIRKEVQQRARALQNPTNLLVLPFTAINLDPIFIWQTNVGSFKGSQIAPGDSWVKFLMEATSGSFSTNYSFVFYWQNQRNDLAVVNVASSLVLNGFCQAFAATGFFSGDICYVDMVASLTLLGLWQADPQNPELPPPTPAWQQSQYQPVTNLQAQGGGLFGSVGVQSQTFSASSYGLSYDFFLIPPQSSAAFEVSLDVGIILNGFVGDNATTVAVGVVEARTQQLLQVTQEALRAGIAAARAGNGRTHSHLNGELTGLCRARLRQLVDTINR